MTLTEFLLARIAEDEAIARAGFSHPDRCTPVLAECEAKRRIVNAWRSGWPDDDRYTVGWHDFHVTALTWLALPYANHPDYNERWRP